MWALLASKVIAGIDRSRGSAVMHLVTAQHIPGSRGNKAFPLSRRAVWCNGLSLLLVTRLPWPPFFSPRDLLVGKGNILTISHLLPKAREAVLLHKYRLEGAYR